MNKKDNPYYYQNSPDSKDRYTTYGNDIQLDMFEILDIKDVFGKKPTDIEIQNWRYFCKQERVPVDVFDYVKEEIFDVIKKVIMSCDGRKKNKILKKEVQ